MAMNKCYYYGKSKDLLIHKRFGDLSAINGMVTDMEPCDECKEFMRQGVILISVRDGEPQSDNPFRTCGWWVIKDEAIKRIFPDELAASAVKRRVMFIEDGACDKIGLKKDV